MFFEYGISINLFAMSIQLADGNRGRIHEISLKTRKFIGNTSMDATLSLLMANQAMVKQGDLVYDPFVGTGSLLVAAAKFGGNFVFRILLEIKTIVAFVLKKNFFFRIRDGY